MIVIKRGNRINRNTSIRQFSGDGGKKTDCRKIGMYRECNHRPSWLLTTIQYTRNFVFGNGCHPFKLYGDALGTKTLCVTSANISPLSPMSFLTAWPRAGKGVRAARAALAKIPTHGSWSAAAAHRCTRKRPRRETEAVSIRIFVALIVNVIFLLSAWMPWRI